MGWIEFTGWLGVMKRQNEAKQVGPGSWAGANQDEWWLEAWRKRAEEQRRR